VTHQKEDLALSEGWQTEEHKIPVRPEKKKRRRTPSIGGKEKKIRGHNLLSDHVPTKSDDTGETDGGGRKGKGRKNLKKRNKNKGGASLATPKATERRRPLKNCPPWNCEKRSQYI